MSIRERGLRHSLRASGDKNGRPDGQHQQQKRKNDDVDQPGVEILRRIAFNEAGYQSSKYRSFYVEIRQ